MGVWNPGPSGTNGNDTFVGNATNETIEGLGGEDNLQGNDGDDTFVISAASHISAGDFYYGGNGADVMRLTAAGTYNFQPTTTLLLIETLRLEANLTANFTATYWDDDWGIINGWAIDGGGRTATFNFYAQGGANIQVYNWAFSNGNFTINMYASAEGSTLLGSNIADQIFGAAGNDTLRGFDGADTLNGGAGNDTYFLSAFFNDAVNDTIVELAGGGIDTVQTESSFSLAGYANIENLESATNAGITLTGNNLDNNIVGGSIAADTLIGGAGNDTLGGRSGADTLIGGTGDDTYLFSQEGAVDTITENLNEGTDTIIVSNMNSATVTSFSMANYANVENLQYNSTSSTGTRTITGNSGANVISAFGAVSTNDVIDGGAGNDTMSGAGGNDTYIVDSLGDVVVEAAGGGTDTIQTTAASYVLSSATDRMVENLTYTGAVSFIGSGNDLNNILTGGAADDTLNGGAGNDTLNGGAGADAMSGGAGDDTYVVDNAGDAIGEAAGEGADSVQASVTYTLAANLENLALMGSANLIGTGNGGANSVAGNSGNNVLDGASGNDVLFGLGGNDTLVGGLGADTMAGGLGDDVHYVDSNFDTVTELSGEGYDWIFATVSLNLPANIEGQVLLEAAGQINAGGNAADNYMQGNSFDNGLDGGAGTDSLFGLGGNDVLFGGGLDNLFGGIGNDIYIVDNPGTNVTELAGEGYDWIFTTSSFTMLAHVDGMILEEAGGAINAAGNAQDNYIQGNNSNNGLDGSAGTDSLFGLGGNDVLFGGGLDNLFGGTGDDIYIVDNPGTNVTELAGEGYDWIFTTSSFTMQAHVDGMLLQEPGGAINAAGNAQNNYIQGNTSNNGIDGGAGADTLVGFGGDDTFVFQAGQANGDTINDFIGNGAATGDRLVFQGYGTAAQGATFTQLNATQWQITSANGLITDILTLANGAAIDPSDYFFGP